MGALRLLLALAVVIAHSTAIFGWHCVGGVIAVQAFYTISGFYMSLILHEKYIGERKSYSLFITNRLLRLYPVYWAVLGLTIAVSLIGHATIGNAFQLQQYFDSVHIMSTGTLLFLLLANMALIGQDAVMFMGLNTSDGTLFFTPDFSLTHPPLHRFLLVPQAWTIAVEIMFYLFAPFLVKRKTWLIIALVAASLLLRAALYQAGLYHDPWTYRFFPTELAFFLAGILSYRLYRILRTKTIQPYLLRIAFSLILLFTFSFQWIPIADPLKQWIYYISFSACLPFIFILTGKNRMDKAIGELSYPVYICHYLVILCMGTVMSHNRIDNYYLGMISIAATILLSLALVQFIIKPIERIRQNRVASRNIQKEGEIAPLPSQG